MPTHRIQNRHSAKQTPLRIPQVDFEYLDPQRTASLCSPNTQWPSDGVKRVYLVERYPRSQAFPGVVAKKHSSRYRSGQRGWVKKKNPSYWRRDSEREAMQKAAERRLARL